MFRSTAFGVVAGAGMLACLAGPASAADVSVTSQHRLVLTDSTGAKNDLTLSGSGASLMVSDTSAPLAAGTGCSAQSAGEVTCAGVASITADLGAGDDMFHNNTDIPSSVRGGDGNDTIYGGGGDDSVLGESGVDQIFAGAGNDRINTRGGLADAVDCGPGQDVVAHDAYDHLDASCEELAGGAAAPPPGADPGTTPVPGLGEAPAPSRTGATPVPVVLPSAPGTPAPIAVVLSNRSCTTQFIGTAARDRIDGTGHGDRLFGMGGNDVLNGLGGSDCLYGLAGNDRLYGGNGADRLSGGRGADRLAGGRGNDTLVGAAGSDSLLGGPGRDAYRAGDGKDTIDARDGERDTIDCGSGRDVARVDRTDRVRRCERVIVGRAPRGVGRR
jgi:Ca2+-binding RTX toxin-like protein